MERGLPVPKKQTLRERLHDINIDELQTSEEVDEYFKGNPKGAREFKNQMRQFKQNLVREAFSINPNGSINPATGRRAARDLNNTNIDTRDGVRGTFTRLNLYQHWLGSAQQIAIANPMVRPFFTAIRKYSYVMRKTQSTFNDFFRALGALGEADKTAVNRFITAANIIGAQAEIVTKDGTMSIIFPQEFVFRKGTPLQLNGRGPNGEWEIKINKETGAVEPTYEGDPVYTEEKAQEALEASMGWANRLLYDFKIGVPIELTNKDQVTAYQNIRTGMDIIFDEKMASFIRYLDDPEETFYNDIVDEWEANPIVPLSTKLYNTGKDLSKSGNEKLGEVVTGYGLFMEEMEGNKKTNYYPNIREGDGFLQIIHTYTDPKTGKKTDTVTYRSEITIPWYIRGPGRQAYMRKWAQKNIPAEVFENNPEGTEYKYTYVDREHMKALIDDQINFEGVGGIESLVIAADESWKKGKGDTNARVVFKDHLVKVLNHRIAMLRKRGFEGHFTQRTGVPGYIIPLNKDIYHQQSYAVYSSRASRYLARVNTEKEIESTLKVLDKQFGKSKLPQSTRDYYSWAKETRDFTYSPQSMWSMAKSIAFFGLLGGSISSIMVNLSQSNVTAATLFGVYGARVKGNVLPSFKDAAILTTYLSRKNLYLPSLNNPNEKMRSDAEELYKTFHKLGLIRHRDEYNMLAELAHRGTIARINTEAIAQNTDVSTNYLIQKIGLPGKFSRGVAMGGSALTTLYAWGEITNRIGAALATYRAAEAYGVAPMNDFNGGIEILESNLLDNEEGRTQAAQIVVNYTQFNLDAFNRPRLARILGGVPIQFIPFVTMMIELYANGLWGRHGKGTIVSGPTKDEFHKVGWNTKADGYVDNIFGTPLPFRINNKQAARFLIGLTAQQMALAGIFGFPFMDDLDEVIRKLSKHIPFMSETSIFNEFRDALVDDLGWSPDAADMLLRGPVSNILDVSLGRRLALSPFQGVLRSFDNPAMLIGGPAASFLEGYGGRLKKAFIEKDWIKAAIMLPPAALTQHLYRAYDTTRKGVTTGGGRFLLGPAGMKGGEGADPRTILLAAMGFTTDEVSKTSGALQRAHYMKAKMKGISEQYTDLITHALVAGRIANDKGDYDEVRKQNAKISKWLRDIKKHDEGKKREDMIDGNFNILPTAINRSRLDIQVVSGQKHRVVDYATLPKHLRQRVLSTYKDSPPTFSEWLYE